MLFSASRMPANPPPPPPPRDTCKVARWNCWGEAELELEPPEQSLFSGRQCRASGRGDRRVRRRSSQPSRQSSRGPFRPARRGPRLARPAATDCGGAMASFRVRYGDGGLLSAAERAVRHTVYSKGSEESAQTSKRLVHAAWAVSLRSGRHRTYDLPLSSRRPDQRTSEVGGSTGLTTYTSRWQRPVCRTLATLRVVADSVPREC